MSSLSILVPFIDAAQKESVEAILESSELRAQNQPWPGPDRFRLPAATFPRRSAQIAAGGGRFHGIDQVAQVSEIVERALAVRRGRTQRAPSAARGPKSVKTISKKLADLSATAPAQDAPVVDVNPRPVYIPDFATPRFRLTPRHFAYVKIAEGCNHPCSFCIIPRMRGRTAAVRKRMWWRKPGNCSPPA